MYRILASLSLLRILVPCLSASKHKTPESPLEPLLGFVFPGSHTKRCAGFSFLRSRWRIVRAARFRQEGHLRRCQSLRCGGWM